MINRVCVHLSILLTPKIVKGKDDLLEAKFHRNTVQNKLKKLIGSSKPTEKLDHSSKMQNQVTFWDNISNQGTIR